MAVGSKVMACSLAAAAACSALSAAFVAPRGAGAPSQTRLAGLRGAGAHDQAAPLAGAAPLSLGAVAGLATAAVAAAAAAARRRRSGATPRPAFADGLVGSEYHGWGKYEWDPLELSTKYPEHLPWYREAELKHGRVSMLAFLGFIAPDAVRLPIEQLQDPSLDMVNAHKRLIGPGLGEGPMWWLLLFCGVVESLRFRQLGLGFEKLTLENAGDLDFGKGFMPKTEEGQIQMRVKELKNGRLAMLAVSGILTQSVVWDSPHFPFVPVS